MELEREGAGGEGGRCGNKGMCKLLGQPNFHKLPLRFPEIFSKIVLQLLREG